jgi:hypothetical protein
VAGAVVGEMNGTTVNPWGSRTASAGTIKRLFPKGSRVQPTNMRPLARRFTGHHSPPAAAVRKEPNQASPRCELPGAQVGHTYY